MSLNDEPTRLTTIVTNWDLLRANKSDDAGGPSRELVLRYYGAVKRYLLGIVRDEDAANDLAQEFAGRFLRGDFRKATPERGRFRDFLKVALRNLAMDHFRKQKVRAMQPLPDSGFEAGDDSEQRERDEAFVTSFREEVLARTWETMAQQERSSGKPYHTVLRFEIQHPDLAGAEMAKQLSVLLCKPVSDTSARMMLHRARTKFADLLLDEVSRTLGSPSHEEIGQELSDLQLLDYCKSALERRIKQGSQ